MAFVMEEDAAPQGRYIMEDEPDLSVDFDPAILKDASEGMDIEKIKTAFTDADTISTITGVDFPPSEAYKHQDYLDAAVEKEKQKRNTWSDIFGGAYKGVYPSFRKATSGTLMVVEDIEREATELFYYRPKHRLREAGLLSPYIEQPPTIEAARYEEHGRELFQEWTEKLRAVQPEGLSPDDPLKYYANMIIQNTVLNAPILAVSAASGQPEIALMFMAWQSGATKYGELRIADPKIPISHALVHSSVVGAFERWTEKLPTEALIKAGTPFAKRLLLVSGLDVPGEWINTTVDSLVDKVVINPGMTLGEFVTALMETTIVSLGSAGILTTTTHPIVWARENQQRIREAKEKLRTEQAGTATNEAFKAVLTPEEAAMVKGISGGIEAKPVPEATPGEAMPQPEISAEPEVPTDALVDQEAEDIEFKKVFDEVFPSEEVSPPVASQVISPIPVEPPSLTNIEFTDRATYQDKSMAPLLENRPGADIIIAVDKETGKDVGFYLIQKTETGFKGDRIEVDKDAQGKKIGEALLVEAQKRFGNWEGATAFSPAGMGFFQRMAEKGIVSQETFDKAVKESGVAPIADLENVLPWPEQQASEAEASISKAKAEGKTFDEWVKGQGDIPKPILSEKELSDIAQLSDNQGLRLSLSDKKKVFSSKINDLKKRGIKYIDAYHVTNSDINIIKKEGLKGSELDYIGRRSGNLREKSVYLFLDPDDINFGKSFINSAEKEGNAVVHIKIPIERLTNLNWDSNFNLTAGTYTSERFLGDIPKNWIQNIIKTRSQLKAEWEKTKVEPLVLVPTEMPAEKPKPATQQDLIKVQPKMPETAIEVEAAGHPMLEEITQREEAKRQQGISFEAKAKAVKAARGNAETDSLATYIRKEGGFNYQKEHMKGELDRLSAKETGSSRLLNKKGGGYTLDQMLEKAIEDGYFNENATINDLLDAVENETYMKKKHWSTQKLWTDKELGEMMAAGMESEEKSMGSLLKDLNVAIGEEGVIGGKSDISKVIPILSKIGKKIYADGHKTYAQFNNKMKEAIGTTYSKVKDYIYRIWQAVKQFNKQLGERGAIGREEQKGYEQGEFPFGIKELKDMYMEAVKAAKEARKAGYEEGVKKEKQKLRNILDRGKKLTAVRDYFGLTDTEMKKISRRNPLLMSQYEFKIYLDNVRQRALELVENSFEKARIMYHILERDLKKVDNYRIALGLPPITKMTTEQAAQFADLLEPFHDGDTFLTIREIETVDRTDLAGIRTWREAKERLAKEIGIPVSELNKIKVTEFDKFRWDTALAERNPFYKMVVLQITRKLLEGNLRYHDVESEVFRLAKRADKSRKRGLVERLIPQDKQIFEYLESPAENREALAREMTPEQLDYASYMQTYFKNALEHLLKIDALEKGRENYFVHVRRSFLENAKESGIINAVKDIFKSYQDDMAVFQILDKDTGNILPLEKFFQFALHRMGGMEPSANITKAFLTYARTFERKVSFDEIIPKIDIYAQSLTPQRLTPRGLERDRSIKTFINEYINNKKGRHIDQMVGKQGGVIDVGIRVAKTFTTLLDLGLNIPVGLASYVGESAANFIMLGAKKNILGDIRIRTRKGKAIIKKYEAFVGRSVWENFTAPGREVQERFQDVLFGLFHSSMVHANEHFLLGELTKEEYDSGIISNERLAELQIEMGRWRVVPGTKSLAGSTSLGSAAMQYKTWAAPIIRTGTKDITTLLSDLKNKPIGEALTTREARELYRIIGLTTTAIIVGAMAGVDDKDNSFVGQLIKKAYREAMTLLQGVDPSLWLATPRVIGFITELGKNLHAILLLEEYKTKKGYKGVEGLKKQVTPRAVKQFQKEKKK